LVGGWEAGGLRVWSQPELHSKFQANLSYTRKPCLKTNTLTKIKIVFCLSKYPGAKI
jgi:hypothetical protein